MVKNIRSYCRPAAPLLASCLFLCQACSPYAPPDKAFGTAPRQAASDGLAPLSPSSLPENESQAQAEFMLMKEELCQGLASLDYMTQHFYYQDPEGAGLIPCYPAFWDISETGWEQRMELIKSLKLQLDGTEKNLLSQEQQFSWQVLSSYANLELALEGTEHFRLLRFLSPEKGLMVQVPRMLALLPLSTRQDVEDYFTLLSDMPRLFGDLIRLCEEASGEITFTRKWLMDASAACAPFALEAGHNSLAASFSSRLAQVPGLTSQETGEYEARHERIITQSVIPAYQKLSSDILKLPAASPDYEGLCGQKNGRLYYSRLLNRRSGTSYGNIRQLLSAIEGQLEQNALLLNQLLEQAPSSHEGQASPPAKGDPEQVLLFLETETKKYFPAPADPADTLWVRTVPAGMADSLALPGLEARPFDPSGEYSEHVNRALLIDQRTAGDRELLYAALSYTGFPGRFYRENYLSHHSDTPLLTLLSFPGWEKGWDLYGRSYAISYENGLTPEERQLARLSLSSFTAIHALIDIQVNYYGWSLKDVEDFLSGQYGLKEEGIAQTLYRHTLYAPGDSAVEYAGYLEIRQIKAQAANALGDSFSEEKFHRLFLDTGPAPFGLIREQMLKEFR